MAKNHRPSRPGRMNGQTRSSEYDTKKKNKNNRVDGTASEATEAKPYHGFSNPFSWYDHNPLLTQAVGAIPYAYRPGMQFPLVDVSSVSGNIDMPYTIPGVLAIRWVPSVGTSNQPTDPISLVGKDMFAKVREKFSGSIDADAPDFAIYMMAMDAPFSYIAFLKRLYRTLVAYTPNNFVTPDGLLTAMGFSKTQIVELKADRTKLWQITNELIGMTRRLHVPAKFDVLNRHYWLNDNYFVDDAQENAQIYMFVQQAWFKYNEQVQTPIENVKAGGLELTPLVIPETGVVEYLFSFGKALIDALTESDDTYIISGYLARAYEGTPDFVVDQLQQVEPIDMIYDRVVLGQIENCWALPVSVPASGISNTISQNPQTNAVIANPAFTANVGDTALRALLQRQPNFRGFISSRELSPTVENTIENSRLKTAWTAAITSAGILTGTIECATEIPIGYQLVIWSPADQAFRSDLVTGQLVALDTSTGGKPSEVYMSYILGYLTQFDWRPIWLQSVKYGTATATRTLFTPLGDVHNLAPLPVDMLSNMHRISMYSLFDSFAR